MLATSSRINRCRVPDRLCSNCPHRVSMTPQIEGMSEDDVRGAIEVIERWRLARGAVEVTREGRSDCGVCRMS